MSTVADRIDAAIDERLPQTLNDLAGLVGQPSVSSQNVGIEECARLVASLLESRGFQTRILPTSSYPIVYGEAEGQSDRTLICYNHYDVQPAEPLDLWESPPFELTRRGDALFGRGVADDKGHIISRLAALDALRDATGGYPCNIKFIIEGGEEISSPGVPEFVQEHTDLLAADGCVWETGGVDFEGRPQLTLGMRGICYVQYNASTMSRDAHSGSGHLLPNAAWRLVRALNTVATEDHILIPGFYDDVRPITDVERALLEDLESHEQQTKEMYGIQSFIRGLTGQEAKEAVYAPTANIAGLSSGYEGPGSKTVIPARAMAKMDFRLVPEQDPKDILEKLRRHLEAEGYGDVEVEYLGGERPAQTPPDDPFVQVAAQTAQEVYGAPPRITPLVGGSGPMYPFREYLGVPIVSCGVGYPGTLVHAPNENIRLGDFILGTRHMTRLVQRFAEMQ